MANFYAQYPASSGGSSANASVGINGVTAPTSSTEVGGINPSGNLQPLQTDASGNLLVSLAAEPINPFSVNLSAVGGAAISEGQKLMAASLPVVIASDQSTLPISAASLPLPTGAATSANQTNASQKTQVVDGAGAVITSTNDGGGKQGLDVNIAGSATLSTTTNLIQVGSSNITLGQKTEVASLPVVIASDQSSIPVTVASLPLPTGGSTAALQSSVQSAPGTPQTVALTVQGNASGVALPISASALPLPTGAATSALQTTGNTTLSAISGQLPATLGQKAMAASLPVVIASDQSAIPVATVDLVPATQNITVIDSGSSTASGFNNQSLITGTPTAGSAASFAVGSKEGLTIEIKGTWTGTIQFEVSIDGGTTWTPHSAHQFGSPNFVTAVTANFIASLNMAAKTNFRARATAAMTGTATILIVESANQATTYVANAIKLVDATAAASPPQATIKAASTAAIATDTSLVVALSPNSTGVVAVTGSSPAATPVFNSNSANNITTGAYLQLTASTTVAARSVEVYNQSASSIFFAVGAAASEVNKFIIPPGGNGLISIAINATSRISVKAVDVNATTGSLIVNYWT